MITDQQYVDTSGKNVAWFYVYCKCNEAVELKCNEAISVARDLYQFCLKRHGKPIIEKKAFGVFGELGEAESISDKKVKRLTDAFSNNTGGIFEFVRRLQKSNK